MSKHFLEEGAIGDGAQSFQHQEHTPLNKGQFFIVNGLIEQLNVALLDSARDLHVLRQIVLHQQLLGGHLAAEQLQRYKVDEEEPLVTCAGGKTVVEGKCQFRGSRLEVAVEEGAAAMVVGVCDAVADLGVTLELGELVNEAEQRLGMREVAGLEAAAHHVVDQRQHAPALGRLLGPCCQMS